MQDRDAAKQPEIDFRPAAQDDFSFLRALHRATMQEYVAPIWGWDDALQEKLLRERFDPAKLRIIRVDGQDEGALQVEEKDGGLFIANIMVSPACQNRGVGARIIGDIIIQARERGMGLGLSVLRTNPARRLYERLGFAVTGQDEARFFMTYGGDRK